MIIQPYSQSPDGSGEILPHVLPGQGGHDGPRVSNMECLVKPGAETWYVFGMTAWLPAVWVCPRTSNCIHLSCRIFSDLWNFIDFKNHLLPIPFVHDNTHIYQNILSRVTKPSHVFCPGTSSRTADWPGLRSKTDVGSSRLGGFAHGILWPPGGWALGRGLDTEGVQERGMGWQFPCRWGCPKCFFFLL